MQLIRSFIHLLIPALCFPFMVFNALHRRMEDAFNLKAVGEAAANSGTAIRGGMSSPPVGQLREVIPKSPSSTFTSPSPELSELRPNTPAASSSNIVPKKALSRIQNLRDKKISSPRTGEEVQNNVISGNLAALQNTKLGRTQGRRYLAIDENEFIRMPKDPIPESFAKLRKPKTDAELDPLEGESSLSRSALDSDLNFRWQPEIKYEPIFTNPKAIASERTPRQLVKDSIDAEKALNRIAEILEGLSADERLRGTVDSKFIMQEFRKSWLEKVPPESREDPNLLAGIGQVEQKVSRLLKLSQERVKIKKPIIAEIKTWGESLSVQRHGLKESLLVHIKAETEVVRSKMALRFQPQNWHPDAVRPHFEEMVDEFVKHVDFTQLGENLQAPALRNKLLDELAATPQGIEDPEWQFIFQKLSNKHYDLVKDNLNADLVELNQRQIARNVDRIMMQDLVNLKFQYHVVEPLRQVPEGVSKEYLTSISKTVAQNDNLMKTSYEERVNHLVQYTSEKVEAEFFNNYFGIKLSSKEIYAKLKTWGDMWDIDFKAFQKTFRNELPPGDYQALYSAASRSKLEYADLLEDMKDQKEITSFKQLEAKFLRGTNNEVSQKSIENYLQLLNEKAILKPNEYASLQAELSRSNSDFSQVFQVLRNKLQVDLFDKLEVGSIPQRDLASTQSSITNFLDDLRKKGLLTAGEQLYLDPKFVEGSLTSPIEEFSRKIDELEDLPGELRNRVVKSASSDFQSINRDQAFISNTLKNKIDELQSYHDDRISNSLRESDYDQIYTKLQPQAIEKEIREDMSDEAWAKALWDDYFHRNSSAYRTYDLLEQKLRYPNGAPEKGRASGMEEKQEGKVLLEEVLGILAEDGSQILPQMPDFGHGVEVSEELNSIVDRRNYILLHKPLKVGDARLQGTPFAYLKQPVIDDWNASVQHMAESLPEMSENIFRRNFKTSHIEKNLQSLQDYNLLISQVLKTVNMNFRPLENARNVYELSPEGVNPYNFLA